MYTYILYYIFYRLIIINNRKYKLILILCINKPKVLKSALRLRVIYIDYKYRFRAKVT